MTWHHLKRLRTLYTASEVETLLILASDPRRSWDRRMIDDERGVDYGKNGRRFREFAAKAIDAGHARWAWKCPHGGRGRPMSQLQITPNGLEAVQSNLLLTQPCLADAA